MRVCNTNEKDKDQAPLLWGPGLLSRREHTAKAPVLLPLHLR